ncbi:MAG: hypothetical protein HLX50_01075 [Alteromonadaceae bacterium]|nr:hypothetical protein [Alteromonadaceae bacterium]
MQKLILVLLSILMLGGCAGVQPSSKNAEGNKIISSSYPAATFVIDDTFELQGHRSGIDHGGTVSPTTSSSSSYTGEHFVYVDSGTGTWVDKIVAVSFLKLNKPRWTWERTPEWTGKSVIEGTIETRIGELDTYTTFTRLPGLLDEYNLNLTSKNVHLCGAVVTMRQIPSGMARYKHSIDYMEPIRCSETDQFFYGDGSLTNTGRLRLERVFEHAQRDVRIYENR